MRNGTPTQSSPVPPASPADGAEPLVQLWDLWLQVGLGPAQAGAQALELWRHGSQAWSEAVLQAAAAGPLGPLPDAAAQLMCGWAQLCTRAAGLQLHDAGVTTPLLSDA